MKGINGNDRYYYHTDQRSHSLCLCTCGYEHSTDTYFWGPGKRPYFCLSHVDSGSAAYVYNGETYRVQAGDSFVAFPNGMQYVRSDKDTPWAYYWVGFTGSEAASILHKMGFSETTPVLYTAQNETAKKLFQQIYSLRGSRLSDSMAMTGALYILFSALYKALDCDRDIQPDIMQKALEYIESHWDQNIQIGDICKAVNVSHSWLYRQFMKNVGESPVEYLLHQRINRSCYYLGNTNMSVSEVAAKCGFNDPLYYSRMFKKQIGLSPRQYHEAQSKKYLST